MSKFTDQAHLTTDQYRDSSNLDARMAIHSRFSTNPYGWFNWIFDALSKLPSDAGILEVGGGSGHLWKNIAGRIPVKWMITLSDLSDGMLDAAWRNLAPLGRAFKFEKIDARSIPYADNTFDAVIANHMLYHMPDRAGTIGEIKRVLKPNGRLFATTVGDHHMRELNEWLGRASPDRYAGPFSMPFTLENGMGQLTPFFSEVRLVRYDDNLRVTEVEPILAYIRSTISVSELYEDELARIRTELETRLKEEMMIFISKDSGLFEAVKLENL